MAICANPSASSRSKYLRADPSLGFKVSARTVAKYIRLRSNRGPFPGWGKFLKRHASNMWACDFFFVQTILFEILYVFFVIQHANTSV